MKNLLKRAVSLLCLSWCVMNPSHALLVENAVAPDFNADAAVAGKPFSFHLAEALAKGLVVLYFYPKSFTSDCTVEAHLFSIAMADFGALGATVIGVSNDKIETQIEFSRKECGEKLAVAADPDGDIVRAYGASMLLGSDAARRVTYVIAPNGKIIYVYSAMSPKEHIARSLDAVKQWKAAHDKQ